MRKFPADDAARPALLSFSCSIAWLKRDLEPLSNGWTSCCVGLVIPVNAYAMSVGWALFTIFKTSYARAVSRARLTSCGFLLRQRLYAYIFRRKFQLKSQLVIGFTASGIAEWYFSASLIVFVWVFFMAQIFDPLPSNSANPILCCYVNATSHIQIARITNVSNWYFERVVFPGQRLVFETLPEAHLEIHCGIMASAILSDTIPCDRLHIQEELSAPFDLAEPLPEGLHEGTDLAITAS